MSKRNVVSREMTLHVRDTCLCLHVQRAARRLARCFDESLRPVALTNGQFSLLMSLNRPEAPAMSEIAALLAMDRTTLTAMLKPLQRRGLVKTAIDPEDKRSRRPSLTAEGRALLVRALPIWQRTHALIDKKLEGRSAQFRADLDLLSFG
jgi:DNA-binding MarR family transcriptional regulator